MGVLRGSHPLVSNPIPYPEAVCRVEGKVLNRCRVRGLVTQSPFTSVAEPPIWHPVSLLDE